MLLNGPPLKPSLAPQLKIDYPEVEEYVRFNGNGRTRLEQKWTVSFC